MATWYTADYFDNFHCKMGACRRSCCTGWKIGASGKDYFRIIGMDCSEELHRKLEYAFKDPDYPTPERYKVIEPNWLGVCPILTEDGLCMLHAECGEEALTEVCRSFPRSVMKIGTVSRACCSLGCERVVEMMFEAEGVDLCLSEREAEAPAAAEVPDGAFSEIQKYINCLQDASLSLEEELTEICRLLGKSIHITEQVCREVLEELYEISPELRAYTAGSFSEKLQSEREYRNLFRNHLLYMNFPYTDPRIQASDSVYGLMLLYEILKLTDHFREDEQVDAVTAVFHLAEHTAYYYNAAVLLKGRESL